MIINRIRLFFLAISWLCATISIFFEQSSSPFLNFGVFSLLFFIALTINSLKKESFFIILLLLIVAYFFLESFPSFDDLISGGRFILIFSAFLPTMILVRSVSLTIERIKITQNLLRNLPNNISVSGFQIVSHFFGSVINIGTFSVLSAALQKDCKKFIRKNVAEACLRGMNTSATWSPFFVAFAVGQAFIDKTNSWIAMLCGFFIGILFNIISLPLFAGRLTLEQIKLFISCLSPVIPILSLIMISVLCISVIINLTALSAVLVVMPSLIIIYFIFNQKNIPEIFLNTKSRLIKTSDDITVISFAMLIGYLISQSNTINHTDLLYYSLIFPSWSLLAVTPFIITLFSFFGIHPIVTGTIALSFLTSSKIEIHPALIMQAHLVGWAGGTMSSAASLSVLTCSNLFKVESRKLAYGPNLLTASLFSLSAGILLSLINYLILI